MRAEFFDTDTSEVFSSFSISGFPTGASIKHVADDGTETIIIPVEDDSGNMIFTLDAILLSNDTYNDGDFSDNIYLTVDSALESNFVPTITVVTLDGSSESLTILGGTDDVDGTLFIGGDGNDHISGGADNDILIGGAGSDSGVGADRRAGEQCGNPSARRRAG